MIYNSPVYKLLVIDATSINAFEILIHKSLHISYYIYRLIKFNILTFSQSQIFPTIWNITNFIIF